VECRAQPKGAYTCCYTAPAAGLGVLELTVGACHLRGSPFSVKVMLGRDLDANHSSFGTDFILDTAST
jgi:hypothetical protein